MFAIYGDPLPQTNSTFTLGTLLGIPINTTVRPGVIFLYSCRRTLCSLQTVVIVLNGRGRDVHGAGTERERDYKSSSITGVGIFRQPQVQFRPTQQLERSALSICSQ